MQFVISKNELNNPREKQILALAKKIYPQSVQIGTFLLINTVFGHVLVCRAIFH